MRQVLTAHHPTQNLRTWVHWLQEQAVEGVVLHIISKAHHILRGLHIHPAGTGGGAGRPPGTGGGAPGAPAGTTRTLVLCSKAKGASISLTSWRAAGNLFILRFLRRGWRLIRSNRLLFRFAGHTHPWQSHHHWYRRCVDR